MEYVDGPFPRDILILIRQYPGNQKCCDCSSLDTDWGNINHGTLHCLDCAGRHRRFGVQVSFIRSIYMDTWNPQQIEMMKQGGNGQLREFFKKLKVDESRISTRYLTQAAEYYRHLLDDRVSRIISGDIPSEPYRKNIISDRLSPRAIVSTKSGGALHDTKLNIHAYFEESSLGLTLTRDSKQMAVVSKLVVGGSAQLKGVHVGDVVSGVNFTDMSDYFNILKEIRASSRPLFLTLLRHHQPPFSSSSTVPTCIDQPSPDSLQSPKTSILTAAQVDKIQSLPVSLTIIDKSAHLPHVSRSSSCELTRLDSVLNFGRTHSIRIPTGRSSLCSSKGVFTNPSTEDSSISTFLFLTDSIPMLHSSRKSTPLIRFQKPTVSALFTPLTTPPDSPSIMSKSSPQQMESSNEHVINSINDAIGSSSLFSSPQHIYTSSLFSPSALKRNVGGSIRGAIELDASTDEAINCAYKYDKHFLDLNQKNARITQLSSAEHNTNSSNIIISDCHIEVAPYISVLDDCGSTESSESNSSHGLESSSFSQKQSYLSSTPPLSKSMRECRVPTFEKDSNNYVCMQGLETCPPLRLHDIFLRCKGDNQYHREFLNPLSYDHEHRLSHQQSTNYDAPLVELTTVRSKDTNNESTNFPRIPSQNEELAVDIEQYDSHHLLRQTQDIGSWDAADDPTGNKENCVITSLEDGMKVKVWNKAQRKWKSASIVSIHGDHTLTVKFRNGAMESHVSLERLGLTTITRQASNDTTDDDYDYDYDIDQNPSENTLVFNTDKYTNGHDHELSPNVNPNRENNSNHEYNNFRLRPPNTQCHYSIRAPFQKVFSDDDLYSNATPYKSLALRVPVGDYRITFSSTPLGLSLEACTEIRGVSMITVSKLAENGQAESLGIHLHDSLIGVESMWVDSLDHALSILTTATFPVTLVFRRFV